MKFHNLKPCPFCGGEVRIALKSYAKEACFFITRGYSKTKGQRVRHISEYGLKRPPQSWQYVKEE